MIFERACLTPSPNISCETARRKGPPAADWTYKTSVECVYQFWIICIQCVASMTPPLSPVFCHRVLSLSIPVFRSPTPAGGCVGRIYNVTAALAPVWGRKLVPGGYGGLFGQCTFQVSWRVSARLFSRATTTVQYINILTATWVNYSLEDTGVSTDFWLSINDAFSLCFKITKKKIYIHQSE